MHEMILGDFDIMHTVQSAQPLTFFGDEKKDGRGVVYTYGKSLIEVERDSLPSKLELCRRS